MDYFKGNETSTNKAVRKTTGKRKSVSWNKQPTSKKLKTTTTARDISPSSSEPALPLVGPSHHYVSDSESSSKHSEFDEIKICCVCKLFTSTDDRNSISLVFTK